MKRITFTDMLRDIKPGESKEFPMDAYDLISKRQLVSRLNVSEGYNLSTTYMNGAMVVTNNRKA